MLATWEGTTSRGKEANASFKFAGFIEISFVSHAGWGVVLPVIGRVSCCRLACD